VPRPDRGLGHPRHVPARAPQRRAARRDRAVGPGGSLVRDPDRLREYQAKGWLTPNGTETVAGIAGEVTDTGPNGEFGPFFQEDRLVSYVLTPQAGPAGVVARAAAQAARRAR
jgi:hypothetical protein